MNHFSINRAAITHRKQQFPYSCGATCISMLFDIPERGAMCALGTDKSGTCDYNVISFLRSNNVNAYIRTVNKDFTEAWWLENISRQFPVYVKGFFKKKMNKRGRWDERLHAILLADGMIYDPSEPSEFPFDAFNHVFDKLTVERIIIIDSERLAFGRSQ